MHLHCKYTKTALHYPATTLQLLISFVLYISQASVGTAALLGARRQSTHIWCPRTAARRYPWSWGPLHVTSLLRYTMFSLCRSLYGDLKKETYKRDLHKRHTKKPSWVCTSWHSWFWGPLCITSLLRFEMFSLRMSFYGDLQKRNLQKRPTQRHTKYPSWVSTSWHSWSWAPLHVTSLLRTRCLVGLFGYFCRSLLWVSFIGLFL